MDDVVASGARRPDADPEDVPGAAPPTTEDPAAALEAPTVVVAASAIDGPAAPEVQGVVVPDPPHAEEPEVVAANEPTRLIGSRDELVRVVETALAPRALARRVPSERPSGAPLPETSLDVYASDMPTQLDVRLVLAREPYGPRAAAFRNLRVRLAQTDARVIAVTSAEPGEGKTTCAVNLALALAEGGGAKTLLVEANFRAPAIARMLGFKPPEGFAAQLERHREAPREPWSVVELAGPRLHVLAVDEQALCPVVLDHVAFGIAMARLRLAGYDYIVVDTPPVLGGADVNLVVDAVDGVLIATLARRSTGRSLRQAVEQLDPAPILGAVVVDA